MEKQKVQLNATVGFLIKEGRILLAMKTEKIGIGCWNGYGGDIEKTDKSIKYATIRELKEETKEVVALAKDLEKIAIANVHNTKTDGRTFVCKVHFYIVKDWTGEAKETDTMIKPTWFDIYDLPYEKMMPADRYWLHDALSGKKMIVDVKYGPFQKKLLEEPKIKYVKSFDEE
ncbi:MAG: NUDIX domain-containing protein [Parcubacteria group bacterium]|nr:NUDIX domain-containing protein [Parcubacteria group bacterium]